MPDPAIIHLPLFQHFDCHGCLHCCRKLVVNVTAQERRKIIQAGWADRIPGRPLFEAYRFRGRRWYRLAQQADGGCIFLDSDGKCRLHAETGLETKPLPCRLYPFVLIPGAETVRVDLRADCPSVASNKGRALSAHQTAIAAFAGEIGVGPTGRTPRWPGARALTARELEAVVQAFEAVLQKASLPFRARLRAGCRLLDLLYTVRIRKVRDQRLAELMELLTMSAIGEAKDPAPPLPVGGRAARLFRQWVFLHAIIDDPADLNAGLFTKLRRSWHRYGQARQFARAEGPVPAMAEDWPATDFASIDRIQPADDDTLEPLCRAVRVKLDAHAFAGPGYFGYDLLSGLTALWLMPAVAGWFARLAAVSTGRDRLTADDVLAGLRRTHHTFAVSPVFGRISERLRLRALARPGVAGALLARYGA